MNTNEIDFRNLTPDILSEIEAALGDLTFEEKGPKAMDAIQDAAQREDVVSLLQSLRMESRHFEQLFDNIIRLFVLYVELYPISLFSYLLCM